MTFATFPAVAYKDSPYPWRSNIHLQNNARKPKEKQKPHRTERLETAKRRLSQLRSPQNANLPTAY
ncbi:hypothetical protein L484_022876 [Morus notabilis]|uniref:Uncharacterized protein n=1 Tax=Morus notabilis TaxID=981085 RepID=W9RK27_9ROSA|nr:hypothetical protein L484_022876 [Morus notabilis]